MNSFDETIKRFFTQSYSENDLKKLFLWLNSEKGHSEINDSFDNNWNTFQYDNNIDIDSEKIILNINKRIKNSKPSQIKLNLRRLLPYAAMLVMVIGFVVFQRVNNKKNQVEPYLTNKYTSVIVENGQRSKVVLPDSTIVWLNSGTTLSYSDNFSQNKRNVILNGQAFFQVAHDKNNPFSVQCNDLIISVLGTKFDVDAYPETGKVSVVLESGKVKLSHKQISTFNYLMTPGELADYDIVENKINISHPDISRYTSWKDGALIFKNDPMKLVIEKLERWYNVDIHVKDQEVYNSIFTGTIRNESYEQIFRLIEFSCPVNCHIINNSGSVLIPQIIISKN